MKKVKIEADDYYPYYCISENEQSNKEIPEDIFEFIRDFERKLYEVQEYLKAIDNGNETLANKQLEIIRRVK